MPIEGYQTVTLDKGLMQRIKKVTDKRENGFKSMAEFVRDSIRKNLIFYEELERKRKKRSEELEEPLKV